MTDRNNSPRMSLSADQVLACATSIADIVSALGSQQVSDLTVKNALSGASLLIQISAQARESQGSKPNAKREAA